MSSKIILKLVIAILLVFISLIYFYKSGKVCPCDPLAYYNSPYLKNNVIHGIGSCYGLDINTSSFNNWINLNGEEILRFNSKLQGVDIKWINNNMLQITLPKEATILSQKLDANMEVKIIINKD